jgi:hypothetical protein
VTNAKNTQLQCLHSMFVLKPSGNYGEIYRAMARFLDEGFLVVYGLGSEGFDVPKNKFENHVYSKIRESGHIDDLERRISTGALRIMDVREIYSEGHYLYPNELLKKWTGVITEVRRGSSDFKGIAVIAGGVKTFTDGGSQDRLVVYEQAILRSITELGCMEVICCYLPESLKQLAFSNLMSIAAAHQCIMENSADHREISYFNLLGAIRDGVEDVLGPGSARLILQTMKIIYNLDEDAIISRPKVFEEKLRKVLGNAAQSVLDSISEKVRELL